jgi:hypothetical protein
VTKEIRMAKEKYEIVNVTNNFPMFWQHAVVECDNGHAFINCGPDKPDPKDCRACKREVEMQEGRQKRTVEKGDAKKLGRLSDPKG